MRIKNLLVLMLASLMILVVSPVEASFEAVTTFPILADFVRQVGGEHVTVRSIVPLGADPHSWEPTPREARLVAGADVIFLNGLDFELWAERLIENAVGDAVVLVTLSEGLTPLLVADDHDDHGHQHGIYDPHMWLDVKYAMEYVRKIAATLSELDSENAGYYQERAHSYLDQLEELDQWLLATISEIPLENRKLITYHNAFGYFAARYGITVEAFLVGNPDQEPSVREMMGLADLLADHPRRAIFTEPQVSAANRYMEALALEAGGKIYTLYSDSLTEGVPTYLEMMRYNGITLLEALK